MGQILLCGKCQLPLFYEKDVEYDIIWTVWRCHEHGVMGWFADCGADDPIGSHPEERRWNPEDFWIGTI